MLESPCKASSGPGEQVWQGGAVVFISPVQWEFKPKSGDGAGGLLNSLSIALLHASAVSQVLLELTHIKLLAFLAFPYAPKP